MNARSEARGRSVDRAPQVARRERPGLRLVGVSDSPAALGVARSAGGAPAGDGARWSSRATLGFILVTCGGFWAAAFTLAAALLRR